MVGKVFSIPKSNHSFISHTIQQPTFVQIKNVSIDPKRRLCYTVYNTNRIRRNSMSTTTMAKNIAEYRKRMGLTQEQLSEMLHLSPQAISKWETGVSHS